MPMKSKQAGENIREFHHGERYQKMAHKFGKQKANKIAVAAGFEAARRASSKGYKTKHRKGY